MGGESDQIAGIGEELRPDPSANRWCFGCGPDNPIGLHLHFRRTADGVETRFVAQPEHQGWDRIVHGGIVMAVLDEALAYAAFLVVGPVVTGELQVRLRRPCPVAQELTAEGRIVSMRHGVLVGEARLLDQQGQIIAEARGKLVTKGSGMRAAEPRQNA